MRWLAWRGSRGAADAAPAAEVAGGAAAPPVAAAPEGRDGAVWLDGGAVRIRNPEGLGRWPIVRWEPGSALLVTRNGEMVAGPGEGGEIVVREGDAITARAPAPEAHESVEVRLDPDEMAARLTVHPRQERQLHLDATEPGPVLVLRPREERVTRPLRLGPADVTAAIRGAGVVSGIDGRAVEEALRLPGHEVVAARGRTAQVGQAAALWCAAEGWRQGPPPWPDGRRQTAETPAGEGGFEERLRQTTPVAHAQIGEPVAQVRLGAEARDGETVTGAAIPAAGGWRPALCAATGVMLSPDGRTAIAARPGRPEVVAGPEEVWVAVYPALRVDADLEEDRFEAGDLWVTGGVPAGRSMRAAGNVQIDAPASEAVIESGGTIRLPSGASRCTLVAGGPGITYAAARPVCADLTAALRDVLGGEPRGPQRVGALAQRLAEILAAASVPLDEEVGRLPELLAALAGAACTLRPAQTARLVDVLQEAEGLMGRWSLRRADCLAGHLDQCRVEATGDVLVGTGGAYRTQVAALGALRTAGPLVAATVRAEAGVAAGEVGSERGLATRVTVGAHGYFEAGRVHAGTLLRIGDEPYEFTSAAVDVRLGTRRSPGSRR